MKKSAFSLLELSISIIIIGILMGIVVQGIKMVASSKLAAARSLTASSPVKNISGLIAWYETTSTDSFLKSEAIDGAQISTWYDISPDSIPSKKNSLTRTASSAITYVANGINKLPSIKFTTTNGTTPLMLSGFYQGSFAQGTVFVVSQQTSISATTGVLFDLSTSGATAMLLQNYVLLNAGTAANISQTITTKPYITAVYLNSSNSKAYLNSISTLAGGSVVNAGSNSLSLLSVGTNRSGNLGLQGYISEVIVYNRPLTNLERKDVINYLSKKHQIAVSGL